MPCLIVTVVLGVLLAAPYAVLRAIGASHGESVAAALVVFGAGVIAFAAWGGRRAPRRR